MKRALHMELNTIGMKLKDVSAQAASKIAAMPATPTFTSCGQCDWKGLNYESLVEHCRTEHPDSIIPVCLNITVNGKECHLVIEPHRTLKEVLQYHLDLIGAKLMCDRGTCGSCTVILNGRPTLSCNTLAADCEGMSVETVEGIAANPRWKPLIDAYCKWDAMQCGYCTPGFVVKSKALLERNPHPTTEEINKALSGNICICGTYPRHAQAILEAADLVAAVVDGREY
jgi:xanthine dehydrogenase YagT iron-sulfur-binding subunit